MESLFIDIKLLRTGWWDLDMWECEKKMEMVTVFKWNEDIVKMDNDFGDIILLVNVWIESFEISVNITIFILFESAI